MVRDSPRPMKEEKEGGEEKKGEEEVKVYAMVIHNFGSQVGAYTLHIIPHVNFSLFSTYYGSPTWITK